MGTPKNPPQNRTCRHKTFGSNSVGSTRFHLEIQTFVTCVRFDIPILLRDLEFQNICLLNIYIFICLSEAREHITRVKLCTVRAETQRKLILKQKQKA